MLLTALGHHRNEKALQVLAMVLVPPSTLLMAVLNVASKIKIKASQLTVFAIGKGFLHIIKSPLKWMKRIHAGNKRHMAV